MESLHIATMSNGDCSTDAATIHTYLNELESLNRSPRTIRLRRYQLQAWARGRDDLMAATREDVVEYLRRPGLEPETRASMRAALTGFYNWAVDTGRIPASPLAGFQKISRPSGLPRPIPDHLVAEAIREADPITRKMIVLGRFAGMRAAEVAQAAAEDNTGTHIRVTGKGRKTRMIPLHPDVARVLEDTGSGWVFPNERTLEPWRPETIMVRVSDALPGKHSSHSLRHSFALAVYRDSGHDLRLVQQLLGHTSPATTARYVQVDDDAAVSVVAGLRLAG